MCIEVLSEESERLLYGEAQDSVDSPVRGHQAATLKDTFAEPLSIKIPENPLDPVVYQANVRPVTVGQSSSMNPSPMHVSGNQAERQPSVDEYNQGNASLLQLFRLLTYSYRSSVLKISGSLGGTGKFVSKVVRVSIKYCYLLKTFLKY